MTREPIEQEAMQSVTDLGEHTQASEAALVKHDLAADQRLVNWADAVKRGDIIETSMYWRLQEQITDARIRLATHPAKTGEEGR